MFGQLSNFQTVITDLFSGINRNTLNSELPQNNVTIKCGTSGMAWVYQQLHHLTGDIHFKEEIEYWDNQPLTMKKEDNFSEAGFGQENTWGLLEGYSGCLLIGLIERKSN